MIVFAGLSEAPSKFSSLSWFLDGKTSPLRHIQWHILNYFSVSTFILYLFLLSEICGVTYQQIYLISMGTMRIMKLFYFFFFLFSPRIVVAWKRTTFNKIITASLTGISLFTALPTLTPAQEELESITFGKFLNLLDEGKVSDVVFNNIRPDYVTITYKNGENVLRGIVKEEFPSYDDPLTPSGPTQVLAKVKSIPTAKWSYDFSSLEKAREEKAAWGKPKKHW